MRKTVRTENGGHVPEHVYERAQRYAPNNLPLASAIAEYVTRTTRDEVFVDQSTLIESCFLTRQKFVDRLGESVDLPSPTDITDYGYPQEEWGTKDLEQLISDYSHPFPDRADYEDEDEWHDRLVEEAQAAYSPIIHNWFAISSYLGERLDHGRAIVLEWEGKYWWGRTIMNAVNEDDVLYVLGRHLYESDYPAPQERSGEAKALIEEIGNEFENTTHTRYWGQQGSRHARDVEAAVQEMGLRKYLDSIDPHGDYHEQVKQEVFAEIRSDFGGRILTLWHEGPKESGIALEDFTQRIIDEATEDRYLQIDDAYEALFNYGKRVRVSLMSNYDCLNSHFTQMRDGGYRGEDSYFADVLHALGISPAVFKREHGDLCADGGTWRRGIHVPRVTTDSLVAELQETTSDANLLSIFFEMNAWEYYSAMEDPTEENMKPIEEELNARLNALPHGPHSKLLQIGLFDPTYGAGGQIDMTRTNSPWTIKLGRGFDRDHNAYWAIDDNGYTYDQVFG